MALAPALLAGAAAPLLAGWEGDDEPPHPASVSAAIVDAARSRVIFTGSLPGTRRGMGTVRQASGPLRSSRAFTGLQWSSGSGDPELAGEDEDGRTGEDDVVAQLGHPQVDIAADDGHRSLAH